MSEITKALIKAAKEFGKPAFNKKVSYGKTNFAYADLGEILRCVKEPLLKNGIFLAQKITWLEEKAWVETILLHESGEIIDSKFPISIANKSMQEIGAQITYIKRYALASMFGLAAEEDNDAQDIKDKKLYEPTKMLIDSDEIEELEDLFLKANNGYREKVLTRAKVKEIEELTQDQYKKYKNFLLTKIKEKNNE